MKTSAVLMAIVGFAAAQSPTVVETTSVESITYYPSPVVETSSVLVPNVTSSAGPYPPPPAPVPGAGGNKTAPGGGAGGAGGNQTVPGGGPLPSQQTGVPAGAAQNGIPALALAGAFAYFIL